MDEQLNEKLNEIVRIQGELQTEIRNLKDVGGRGKIRARGKHDSFRYFDHRKMNKGIADLRALTENISRLGKALYKKLDNSTLPGHTARDYKERILRTFTEIEEVGKQLK
ncbi:uncharacterized protein LOC135716026 [Ochlerotatus camptorhynchus]|uniref:uncharacterized protein LOC135716026 n=1 Tax=Ochlerotatus camptorhynchus TaxID=644619 RepID=UPI0031E1D3B7